MRITTVRGLAAGAGAAALVLASAGTALAGGSDPVDPDDPGNGPQLAAYQAELNADPRFDGVQCDIQPVQTNQNSIVLSSELWAPVLGDNDLVFIALKTANVWREYEFPQLDVPYEGADVAGGNVTHLISCVGTIVDDGATPTEPPTEEPTEEPTENPTEEPTENPTEEPTEPPTEEPTDGPTSTDGPTTTDAPTGPPVETDGPATSGMNVGLLGGAALALAGAGAAGWAMRRSPEAR